MTKSNMTNAKAGDELVFLPLGGSNEIGMNFNLYGYGPPHDRRWIVVDLGVTFGDQTTPGVEIILPDPTFIEEYADRILAIVLTHAHEDHIGAVAWLWPRLKAPLYATPFTAFLLREKLREAGILDDVHITEVPLGGKVELGPFSLELITLTHSIPEPNGLAIRTPLGTILHTGDWKIDPDPLLGAVTDQEAIQRLGDEGVLAMVCDSTNVFVDGHAGSEADVRAALIPLIAELKGKVAVACFASNVARMDSVCRAAEAAGRRVCLVGRSMIRMAAAARSVGLMEGLKPFLSDHEAKSFPPKAILYLCTGSQMAPIRMSAWELTTPASSPRGSFRETTSPSATCRTSWRTGACASTPSATIRGSMSAAIRAATSWPRCTAGRGRPFPCRPMASDATCWNTPPSPATFRCRNR